MRPKTAIVTGASQGIGAGIVRALVARDFNVVATSRKMTRSDEVHASERIALVDGNIGEPGTAVRIVDTALTRFTSIDVLVNNAGPKTKRQRCLASSRTRLQRKRWRTPSNSPT